MGCANCGKSRVTVVRTPAPTNQTVQNIQTPVNCDYTISQLQIWMTKLVCAKNKALYLQLGITAPIMNKYLGIVGSALNYPTNPCHFQSDLDVISNFIIQIAGTELC